jgi:hypothetical protein
LFVCRERGSPRRARFSDEALGEEICGITTRIELRFSRRHLRVKKGRLAMALRTDLGVKGIVRGAKSRRTAAARAGRTRLMRWESVRRVALNPAVEMMEPRTLLSGLDAAYGSYQGLLSGVGSTIISPTILGSVRSQFMSLFSGILGVFLKYPVVQATINTAFAATEIYLFAKLFSQSEDAALMAQHALFADPSNPNLPA